MDGINYGVSYAQSRVPHAPPTAPTAPAPGTWTSASVHEDFRAPVPRAVPIPRFAIRWMHEAGKCIPCRFFAFKEDGCQKGNACEFCHFCGQEAAVRRSKKAHVARRKQEEAALRRERRMEETSERMRGHVAERVSIWL
eukprot:g23019.t1